jgi:hypothetical protein
MDKNELLVKVAAIITTLLETGGSPESMLYIFCDMDVDKWQMMRSILLKVGFVTIKGNYVTLTENGRIKAEKINQVISK